MLASCRQPSFKMFEINHKTGFLSVVHVLERANVLSIQRLLSLLLPPLRTWVASSL
jgi:hypothetical protein